MRRSDVVAVALFVLVAGCKGGGGAAGTCTRDRDGSCTSYPPDRATAGRRMCAGFTWREGAGSCPTEGRLGTCTKEGGAVVELLYAGPPNHFAETTAKSACDGAGGQWTGGVAGSSR